MRSYVRKYASLGAGRRRCAVHLSTTRRLRGDTSMAEYSGRQSSTADVRVRSSAGWETQEHVFLPLAMRSFHTRYGVLGAYVYHTSRVIESSVGSVPRVVWWQLRAGDAAVGAGRQSYQQ